MSCNTIYFLWIFCYAPLSFRRQTFVEDLRCRENSCNMIFKREKVLQDRIQSLPSILSWTHILYCESIKANITAFDKSFLSVSSHYEYDNIWIKSLLKTAMRPFLEWKRKTLSWIDLFLRTAQVTSPFCSVSHKMSNLDPGSQISLAQ